MAKRPISPMNGFTVLTGRLGPRPIAKWSAAWQDHKLILIGGGSLVPLLIDTMRIHPDRGEPLTVMKVAQPTDLVQADQTKIAAEQFPLIAVAYGLANKESFLPNPYCRDPGSFSFGRH
jgi:hypothetical protein